jgi:Asp-tRNA(Asn)/Glu-tRNA(Gln) amidotransferase A subunit family amidase
VWACDRTPGGSSGGDAGLVAARCAPLAIGSDIGGSIRLPCTYCGLFGLKPTTERVSTKGVGHAASGVMWAAQCRLPHACPALPQIAVPRLGDRPGQPLLRAVPGPMARCVEDLALVLRAWFVPAMWAEDPYVSPQPFDLQVYERGRGRWGWEGDDTRPGGGVGGCEGCVVR